jgi:hypothetical protein
MGAILDFLIILLCGAIPIAVLYYGWAGHKLILKQNPCEMTYSYQFNYNLKYEWKEEKYQLYQVSGRDANKLNEVPVLFVAGHKGK